MTVTENKPKPTPWRWANPKEQKELNDKRREKLTKEKYKIYFEYFKLNSNGFQFSLCFFRNKLQIEVVNLSYLGNDFYIIKKNLKFNYKNDYLLSKWKVLSIRYILISITFQTFKKRLIDDKIFTVDL